MIFPHTLLTGVGGTGKTALVRAIGNELNYHFVETHGAAFKKREDLLNALVSNLEGAGGGVLLFFIDEVHRLKPALQEALYSPMKELWIPFQTGRKEIPPFTLMAATTRFDMLDANSFVTRFPNQWEIQRYPEDDIASIIAQEFRKMRLTADTEVVYEIAKRCLGIPRIAVSLADKVRISTVAEGSAVVELRHVQRTFLLEEIDEVGLSPVHRRYLSILAESSSNGNYTPLGVGAIAAKMRQPEDVIKGSVEPILLEFNFVGPTPRGRIITKLGAEYLKKIQEKA
jgi:Holliday junction DNA helicase RuvB